MPTGYTAILFEKEGVTFQEFALRCARAFGALVSMREDDLSAPVPDELTPDDYHKKGEQAARAALKAFDDESDESRVSMARSAIESSLQSEMRTRENAMSEAAKLADMKRQVEAWTPPSEDHAGMKTFMLEQLFMSEGLPMDWYDKRVAEAKGADPGQWLIEQREHLLTNIHYHAKRYAEECERAASRTLWIRQLKDSLRESR